MPCRVTRIAVIGYGYWGAKHVRVLSGLPDVEVTVIDKNPSRIDQARQNHAGIACAGSLAEALDRVDAVVIATSPGSHFSLALQALTNGKHALVEKPFVTAVDDAQRLVDIAAARDLRLMAGHTFEYNAAVWKMKEIINSGKLGRILRIETSRLNLGRYQSDVNVVWDLAPHDISIISFLLDESPTAVSAWLTHSVETGQADVAYLRLELVKAAVTAFVQVSWHYPRKVRQVAVFGDRKMAVYDDVGRTRIRVYDTGVDPADPVGFVSEHPISVTYRTGDTTCPEVEPAEPLFVQDSHFVECVRTGRRPNTPGEKGLEVVRVLNSINVAEAADSATLVGSSAAQPVSRVLGGMPSLAHIVTNGGVAS